MATIMLVEDDRSLMEIYSIRLKAEGYEVVTAGDGEEALAVAVKARPDLVLADVMMPKISGFDMLDILRQTPETKNLKVIMMTALSSDEQRQRGEALGADRYLVKSQVGIEDVVRAVHEVLGDGGVAQGAAVPGVPAADGTAGPGVMGPGVATPPVEAPSAAPAQDTAPPTMPMSGPTIVADGGSTAQ